MNKFIVIFLYPITQFFYYILYFSNFWKGLYLKKNTFRMISVFLESISDVDVVVVVVVVDVIVVVGIVIDNTVVNLTFLVQIITGRTFLGGNKTVETKMSCIWIIYQQHYSIIREYVNIA